MTWYRNGKRVAIYYKAIIGTRLLNSELLRNDAMASPDILSAIQSGYYDPTIVDSGGSQGVGTTIAKAACLKLEKTLSLIGSTRLSGHAAIDSWLTRNISHYTEPASTPPAQPFAVEAFILEDGDTPWEFTHPDRDMLPLTPAAKNEDGSLDHYVACLVRLDLLKRAGLDK